MYIIGRPASYTAKILFSIVVINSALPATSQSLEEDTDFPIRPTRGAENETLTRIPTSPPWSPNRPPIQAPVPYPVPDTAITLNFTHFGIPIPVVRALSTIYGARQRIRPHLASNPEDAPKNDTFEHSTRSPPPAPRVCSVVVQTHPGPWSSWSHLDQILQGLTQFTSGAGPDHQVHYQALEYDVHLSPEGKVGRGRLWCAPTRGRAAAEVDPRANISTTPPDPHVEPPLPPPFPIPGTPHTLNAIWLGPPMPPPTLTALLTGASLKIAPRPPTGPVPDATFAYRTPRAALRIHGADPTPWSLVAAVVAALYRFTHGLGTPPHFRNLEFEVRDGRGGAVAEGYLLAVPAALDE